MSIYTDVKNQIVQAMKAKDEATRDFARVVKAEFDRKGDGQPIEDAVAMGILKALKVTAEENNNAFEIAYINQYLPQELSEAEIEAWIKANLDMSSFKAPMAAIGVITKALGFAAPGDKVKAVIQKMSQ